MNTEFFIAKRIIKGKSNRLSRPIIRIAIVAIALGIAIMILSTAIVTGFQSEIRNKVIGFGSHIQITQFSTSESLESSRIAVQQDFYPNIANEVDEIKHIQIYAIKPGIIQTDNEIAGIIVKGVDANFDWSFFNDKIVEGRSLELPNDGKYKEVLLSKRIADKLELSPTDTIRTYFIKDQNKPRPVKLIVCGIYETGLQEFDRDFVFTDISVIQNLNQWGIEAQLKIENYCYDDKAVIRALAFGGNKSYAYNWNGLGYGYSDSLVLCLDKDTIISVVISDLDPGDAQKLNTIPDTAWLDIKVPGGACVCNKDSLEYELATSGGSDKYYCGGFEIILREYEDLAKADDIIAMNLLSTPLDTRTIINQYPEIFSWLKMIDVNVIIIIVLMIVVGVINMASALLILIIERTNMIGVLKALGSTSTRIRKVFLYNAGYLILVGLFWGNLVGIGFAVLQSEFGFLTLPQESYYLSVVPINLNIPYVILLNVGTLAVCLVSLILPSLLVSRISPVKAIRFE